MTHTEKQRRIVIEILKKNWVYGVNSKIFYNENIFRYPQRMRELRERGYVFASIREPLGHANFYRFWLQYDPYNNQKNNYIPKKAKLWGKTNNKKRSAGKPKYTYEFDEVRQVYIAHPIAQFTSVL